MGGRIFANFTTVKHRFKFLRVYKYIIVVSIFEKDVQIKNVNKDAKSATIKKSSAKS